MDKFQETFEQFKVAGKDLVDKVKELIHEGNVHRIIIKDEKGHVVMEVPVTIATVGFVAAPILTAVGALAAMLVHFTVEVERRVPPEESAGNGPKG